MFLNEVFHYLTGLAKMIHLTPFRLLSFALLGRYLWDGSLLKEIFLLGSLYDFGVDIRIEV